MDWDRNFKTWMAAVVVIAVAVLIGLTVWNSRSNPNNPEKPATSIPTSAEPDEPPVAGSARPDLVAPAAPNSDSKYRRFEVIVKDGKFAPGTIAAYAGDVIHLDIGALDGNYDFTQPDYAISQTLPDGKPRTIEFEAGEPGQFEFFCRQCGGPAKGPVGYLVILAK